MTPRELLKPFLKKLQDQVEDLEEKMATIETTPEDHGDLTAAMMTSFELSHRLRMQLKGTIDVHWEQDFLNHLRRPGFQPHNRKDIEWQMQEQVHASELERIWKDAGILPNEKGEQQANEQERGTGTKESITDIT